MNMQEEIFVPIRGFEGRYEISNKGRVRSSFKCGTVRVLKNYLGTYGYYVISLGKTSDSNLVHRIVAEHFVPNLDTIRRIHVNHIDGNKLNNDANNLEWCTRSENMIHALKTGLNSGVAETHHFAKISNAGVSEIVKMHKSGNFTQREIAKSFGVHQSQISKIITGKRRKYG